MMLIRVVFIVIILSVVVVVDVIGLIINGIFLIIRYVRSCVL